MTRPAFFDTNIWAYAEDVKAPAKRDRALSLITSHVKAGQAIVSLQILQEYFAVATRKLGIPAQQAQSKVEVMAQLRVVTFSPPDVIAAIEIHRLHAVSFWDALILHAARLSGAEILYSEDLQAGRSWGNFRVVNPFIES